MITRQLVRQDVCVYALLALLSLAAFARAAGFGFVGYDDDSYVSANPWVMRGITWDGAKWAFTALKHGTWQPVTWLSFMLDAGEAGWSFSGTPRPARRQIRSR